jgi:hypothetical protein
MGLAIESTPGRHVPARHGADLRRGTRPLGRGGDRGARRRDRLPRRPVVSRSARPALRAREDLRRSGARRARPLRTSPTSTPRPRGLRWALLAAASMRASGEFDYTNAAGRSAPTRSSPTGSSCTQGGGTSWDGTPDATRSASTRSARMDSVAEPHPPEDTDFERPLRLRRRSYIGLPFQYGSGEEFDAVVRFAPSVAWRAPALTGGAASSGRRRRASLARHRARRSAPRTLGRRQRARPAIESPPEVVANSCAPVSPGW